METHRMLDPMTAECFMNINQYLEMIVKHSRQVVMDPSDPYFEEKKAIFDQQLLGGWNPSQQIWGVLRLVPQYNSEILLKLHRTTPKYEYLREDMFNYKPFADATPNILLRSYPNIEAAKHDFFHQQHIWGLNFAPEPNTITVA